MAITFDIKKDLRYRQGLKEGEKRGERRGILQGIELAMEIKFGREGIRLFKKIRDIDSMEKLFEIKGKIKAAHELSEIENILP